MKTLTSVLGIVMIVIAAYLVGQLVWSHGHPKTGSIWFDLAFATLFLLRGIMNLRSARRRRTPETRPDNMP